MWSSRPVCARPVRTFAKSALNAWRVLSIFWSVVFLRSAITMALSGGKSYVNQGALVLAEHHPAQRVLLEDAEDDDRQLLVPAERQRRGVHDLEVAHDRLVEADAGKALGARVLVRVGGVDAVDLGGLDHDLRAHLAAAQRRRRVGGEKRVARPGGEDDDLAFLQVADRLAADVGLDHLLDVERRKRSAGDAGL